MSDDYITIDCIFVRCTEKAILIKPDANCAAHWIPRSCIFGGDDLRVDNMDEDDEVSIKIRKWIAREHGLI